MKMVNINFILTTKGRKMEIIERKKHDFLLVNFCINRIGWKPTES